MSSRSYAGLSLMTAAAVAVFALRFGLEVPVVFGLVALAVAAHLVIKFRPSALLAAFMLATGILFVSRSTLSSPALTALVLPLCTAILVAGILLNRTLIYIPRLFVCLLGANISVVLSSWWFGADGLQVKSLLVLALAAGFMFIGANLGPRDRRRALVFLLIAALAEAGIGVLEGPFGLGFVRSSVAATLDGVYVIRPNTILGDNFNRVQGTVGYPIPFAHLMVLGLTIVFASRLKKSIATWLAAFLVLAIILSGSRSGLFGLAALLLVWMTFGRRDSEPKFSIPLIAGGITFVAAMNYLSRLQAENDFSYLHRAGVIESAENLLGLSLPRILIGNGIDAQEYLFSDGVLSGTQTWAIDNAFVTTLAYGGLIGLLSTIWVVVAVMRSGRSGAMIFLPFVSMFFFYDAFQWYGFAGLFWFFAGFFGKSDPSIAFPAGMKVPKLKEGVLDE